MFVGAGTCVTAMVFQFSWAWFCFPSAHVGSQLEGRRVTSGSVFTLAASVIPTRTTELYSADVETIPRSSTFSELPATLKFSDRYRALISSQTAVIVWLRHSGKWTDSVPVLSAWNFLIGGFLSAALPGPIQTTVFFIDRSPPRVYLGLGVRGCFHLDACAALEVQIILPLGAPSTWLPLLPPLTR